MAYLLRFCFAFAVWAGFATSIAFAHPLGNFTTNHLSAIAVAKGTVRLRYVLDLAEIPTVGVEHTIAADGRPTDAAYQAWAGAHAVAIAPLLELRADGNPLALTPDGATVRTRPGAAGLHTLYFTASFHAALPAGTHRLAYQDRTEDGRLGWKDVVLAPATEPTRELTVYPSALIGSPRQRTTLAATIDAAGSAHAAADPAGDAVAAAPGPSLGRMNDLAAVLDRRDGGPLVFAGALLLALALGALHALEPGHGKTLLAVSLVGARATARQALILASSLTVAHTIGVFVLGAIVLCFTRWLVPEQIYPWVTLASGGFVAVLGARALGAEVRRRRPVAHTHAHVHTDAHPHDHDHAHGLGEHHHHHLDDEAHALAHAIPGQAPLTFRTAVIAASSGNLAPCPAALVVLLAAIALHRIAFGLTLIVAFSIGLAATLTLLGLAVVRGAAWLASRPQFDRVARFAPLVSAGAIAAIGATMLGEGLVAQGIPAPVPVVAGLVILAIVGYAFAPVHRAAVGAHVHA